VGRFGRARSLPCRALVAAGAQAPDVIGSLFTDYVLTPRVRFHSRDELEGRATRLGLEALAYDLSQPATATCLFSGDDDGR